MPFLRVRAERHLSSLAAGMRLTAAAAALSLGAACMSTSDLLTVQNPNAVDASVFDDPSNAQLMVNSVIGDFECAYGSYVMGEGIATDELHPIFNQISFVSVVALDELLSVGSERGDRLSLVDTLEDKGRRRPGGRVRVPGDEGHPGRRHQPARRAR